MTGAHRGGRVGDGDGGAGGVDSRGDDALKGAACVGAAVYGQRARNAVHAVAIARRGQRGAAGSRQPVPPV